MLSCIWKKKKNKIECKKTHFIFIGNNTLKWNETNDERKKRNEENKKQVKRKLKRKDIEKKTTKKVKWNHMYTIFPHWISFR